MIIPEPSPRFILLSAVMATLLLAGIVVFDYATGNEPGSAASASMELHK